MIKAKRNVLPILLSTLVVFSFSVTSVYAAIPSGTVVFGNGQALDLVYANNATHQSEVTQDAVNSNGIYVINFSGSFINNSTNATLTPAQVTTLIPAVTYKDAQGNVKNFAPGNGPETTTNDVITGTTASAFYGSLVTINLTSPLTFAGATQFKVFVNGEAASNLAPLNNATIVYPAQTAGSTVQVELFNAAGTQVGTTQNVILNQTTSIQPTISTISPINVTTTAGTAPVLPATVTANMSDGTTSNAAVTWANMVYSQYASAGTFTVSGTIANTTVKAMANVTVTGTAVSGVGVSVSPANVNSVLGGSQTITLSAEDAYGNPIPNRTIYLQPGIHGLWITQVNGLTIAGLVNMGTLSSTSMQTVNTPVPLFNPGTGSSAPAYQSASVTGLTAYNLQTTPVVALITGADGKVSITLTDGNVTYVANTASTTATNSFAVDPGTAISNKTLTVSSDLAGTQKSGSVLVNWGGGTTSKTLQSIGVNHTALMPNYATLGAVPQTASFTNVVGSDEQMYAAAYTQNGTIIDPTAGNQFDSYALVYDLLAPSGVYFERLGYVAMPVNPTHGGVDEVKAQFTQNGGFVINELIYTDGNIMYSDGTLTTAVAAPSGFDPTAYSSAYDGSGQINFYLNSNVTTAVISAGTAGPVNVNIQAYSNSATTIDASHAQGSAYGTINTSFTASNSIGSLGVAANATGFSQYIPLLDGNAAPGPTLTVAGVSIPAANAYDNTKNATFVVAPFNSYPALSTVLSQGLTMNMSSTLNGVISNVDGYTLASMPNNTSVNVNSVGEVSANNLKLWTAQPGYKVVGYLPGAVSGSMTLIEENLSTLTSFIGVQVTTVDTTGSQVSAWTLPQTSLPRNFEEFLGFNVSAAGALQPMVASYYATNNTFAPAVAPTSGTVATGAFSPVEVAQVYSSDKYSENPVITVSNSINSKTATVTANFSLAASGLVTAKASPSSVNSVIGGSQNITITAQDAYGNPIANQTIYVGTGLPGLWITQVNGTAITSSVNMGTTSSTSMQTVNTPIPLFSVAKAPAYDSASVTGITAYNLQTTPVVALTTAVDGTVSITLVDGNVTYVANTATPTTSNSYAVDLGKSINSQSLTLYSDLAGTQKLGSILLNWA